MRVEYTDEALADLDDIFDYIALDSISRAASVIARIDRKIQMLRHAPRTGHQRPEFGFNVRTLAACPFVVFYRTLELRQSVQIVRVIDGRRDLGTVFFSPLVAA
jgi:toxin ParE1/3/4